MSSRRGDWDFTLQEGGNGSSPPPCPRMTGAHARSPNDLTGNRVLATGGENTKALPLVQFSFFLMLVQFMPIFFPSAAVL